MIRLKKRKDGRWVKVFVIDGTPKSFYSRADTEKKAEKEILQQIAEYQKKEEVGKFLQEVSEEWFETHSTHLEHSTATRYRIFVNQLNGFFPNKRIRQITSEDIEDVLALMVRQQYSTKTIKDFLSVVRMIFKYAKKTGKISENIVMDISAPEGKPSVSREALSEEETYQLPKLINCTFGLLAFFYTCTGMRKGEVLALQWSDIDFERKLIRVNKSLYYVSNSPHIKERTKTKSGDRFTVLPDCLAEVLLPIKGKPDEYVFNKNGKLIDKSYYTRQWEKFKKESNLQTTAYPLRHTYSTLIYEAGVPDKDAQVLMGHRDISTTRNIYTHIRKKRLDQTAQKINDYLTESFEKNSD